MKKTLVKFLTVGVTLSAGLFTIQSTTFASSVTQQKIDAPDPTKRGLVVGVGTAAATALPCAMLGVVTGGYTAIGTDDSNRDDGWFRSGPSR
ncbi:hypothetical protein [Bacillus sp. CDB3]|uniref:hypothetical protein n=1 Tax=Bacillus sp. CDB3 TaxID=360310 RepID=UPI0009D8DA9A|nr:hypothetical protein [Bacillus sp. CDB3]OQR53333.1 hypothetical protein CDB3_30490 [Bacillus sp. CDB3]